MPESERVALVESHVKTVDRDLQAHLTSCIAAHEKIGRRLDTIDRMLWTGLGGLIVIAGLVGMYGQRILHLLAA